MEICMKFEKSYPVYYYGLIRLGFCSCRARRIEARGSEVVNSYHVRLRGCLDIKWFKCIHIHPMLIMESQSRDVADFASLILKPRSTRNASADLLRYLFTSTVSSAFLIHSDEFKTRSRRLSKSSNSIGPCYEPRLAIMISIRALVLVLDCTCASPPSPGCMLT